MDNQNDRKIRQAVKIKDLDFQKQLRQQMDNQQKVLKGYFKQFKRNSSNDSKIISINPLLNHLGKQQQNQTRDNIAMLRQASSPFKIFSTYFQFLKLQPNTPEQRIIHQKCKNYFYRQMCIGMGFSLLATGFTSYKYRIYLTPKVHILGLCTGLFSGLLFGLLSSTKYTLQQFEQLGDSYRMGRMAQYDVQKFRMDKDT